MKCQSMSISQDNLYCLGKLGGINFIYFWTSANIDKQGDPEFLAQTLAGRKMKLKPNSFQENELWHFWIFVLHSGCSVL